MIYGSNYIFVQVPRTSSSSMTKMLVQNAEGKQDSIHTAFLDRNRKIPCMTNRWTFNFVRNPWAREFSQFTYHTSKPDLQIKPTFEQWVLWRYSDYEMPRDYFLSRRADDLISYLGSFSVLPQLGFIMDHDGNFKSDFVGRFETRAEDTSFVLKRLGLEEPETFYHIEGSPNNKKTDYRLEYTDEMRELVGERMKADIEVFNYAFEDPMFTERKPTLEMLTDYSFLDWTGPWGYLHGRP